MISSFPKIFQLGQKYIADIFQEDVELTEKVDGSQFVFGKFDDKLYMRSKGQYLFQEHPEKMFQEGIEYISSIQFKIPDGVTFYCEYLKKPKHNSLCYDRVPRNHLILFGAKYQDDTFMTDLGAYADFLDIEPVPVLYYGKIYNNENLLEFLNRESILGNVKIEGIVVKNYHRSFLLGGQPIPIMAGKLVSEEFKETHRERWNKEEKGKGRLDTFLESFKSEARWEKAVQHLREHGLLEGEPKDIGNLIKEIHTDILEEEAEDIKDFLYNEFKGRICRTATSGFPEWYKQKLLENNIYF